MGTLSGSDMKTLLLALVVCLVVSLTFQQKSRAAPDYTPDEEEGARLAPPRSSADADSSSCLVEPDVLRRGKGRGKRHTWKLVFIPSNPWLRRWRWAEHWSCPWA